MKGFDQEALRSEVAWYLRSMNYHGHFTVKTQIGNTSLKVYSPHWYNHIRLCIFVKTLRLCLSPLFTYFEGRYEVVRSVWWSSRPVNDTKTPSGLRKVYAHGRNEAKLVDFWSAAIAQAVKDRENAGGRVLGLEYLESLQERERQRMAHVGPFLPEQNVAGSSTVGEAHSSSSDPPGRGRGNVNTTGLLGNTSISMQPAFVHS